jgi:TorA maturation chaperone TorD
MEKNMQNMEKKLNPNNEENYTHCQIGSMDKLCRYISAYLEEQNIPKKSTLAKYIKMLYVETGIHREQRREIKYRRRSCRRVVSVESERDRERVRER